VYNTTYFVIIPHRDNNSQNETQEARNSDSVVDKENQNINYKIRLSQKSKLKPKFTYRELIIKALMEKHSLTLSGIYNWICNLYPFYSVTDDKWKNSIRHNLSLYPEFLKGAKTQQSAGHQWYLDQDFRRKQEQEEVVEQDKLVEVRERQVVGDFKELVEDVLDAEDNISDIAIPSFFQDESRFLCHSTPPELQKSAEEILAGIKRPTTVEGNIYLPVPFPTSQEELKYQCVNFPFFDEEREN